MIFLVAYELQKVHMNDQDKFTTRSIKLELYKANSQMILYRVRFSTYILFSLLVSLAFFFSSSFFLSENIYFDTCSTMRAGE